MRWTFTEEGVEIEDRTGGKKAFKRLPITKDECMEFALRVAHERRIYTDLLSAEEQFSSGNVENYRNAVERLSHLIDEIKKAEHIAVLVASDIGVFYDPPGIANEFERSKDLLKFVIEILGQFNESMSRPPATSPVEPDPSNGAAAPTDQPVKGVAVGGAEKSR